MYYDYCGREIEDLEMDNMRRDAREREKYEYPDGRKRVRFEHIGFGVIIPKPSNKWPSVFYPH